MHNYIIYKTVLKMQVVKFSLQNGYHPIVYMVAIVFVYLLIFCFPFLKVAASALESSLIKYSAKDYFFRAALCHLCVAPVNEQHAVQRQAEQFPAFGDSREAKLVKVSKSIFLRIASKTFLGKIGFHRYKIFHGQLT